LFLVGIINVPNYGAKDAHFLGPFITGTVTTALLGVYEALLASKPLLHPFLFRRVRSFVAILVVAFVGGMLFYSLQAWFPMYLETVLGRDEIQVGIDTMPMNSGVNVGGFLSGILLPSLGPRIGTTSILSFGVVLQFIFIPLMCIPGIHDRAMALVFSTIAGFGRILHRPRVVSKLTDHQALGSWSCSVSFLFSSLPQTSGLGSRRGRWVSSA
jgi:Na+/melibiose symporter-like transporter